MDTCDLCGKESADGTWHGPCMREWDEREDAGRCTACGKNDAKPPTVHCGGCQGTDRVYLGYPGVA